MPSRNHPTGLDRRRDASSVPAAAYAIMNRSGPNSAEMSNRSPLRAASTHAAAKAARLTVPAAQAATVRNGLELMHRR
jgi:hypothetical protein